MKKMDFTLDILYIMIIVLMNALVTTGSTSILHSILIKDVG